MVSYADIESKIRAFDLLSFKSDGILGNIISTVEKEKLGDGSCTHVGIAVTSEILDNHGLIPGKVYVFESTSSIGPGEQVLDFINKRGVMGVQLRDFELVIPNYIADTKSTIAWCKLIKNPLDKLEDESDDEYATRVSGIKTHFKQMFEYYHGRLYEMDALGLAGATFPKLRKYRDMRDNIFDKINNILHIVKKDKTISHWQFCSELVANIYVEFGIFSKEVDARNVIPSDFFGVDEDGAPVVVHPPVYIYYKHKQE